MEDPNSVKKETTIFLYYLVLGPIVFACSSFKYK